MALVKHYDKKYSFLHQIGLTKGSSKQTKAELLQELTQRADDNPMK